METEWRFMQMIIPGLFEPPVRTLRATIPENESHLFRYLYTVLLYMPDYKNEPAGIEKLLPWSNFIKERCCRLIDVENQTPEPHEPLPI